MVALQRVVAHRLSATVNGVPTRVLEADTQHGVDQPIGTGSLTLPLPLPAHLVGDDERILNAPVTVQAGYAATGLRTIFTGRIAADRYEVDPRDGTATLQLRGWATLLDWPEETDLTYTGPIRLEEIIRSLCLRRGLASFRIDPILTPTGTWVVLGGNADIDDGVVTIPRRTSPLSWITRKVSLFGYRAFDTPSGEFRVQRVSGLPPVREPAGTYAEGVNCYSLGRSRDLDPMVTYWTVEGPTYTDADGIEIPIRSFPASVPADPLLTPPGYRADRISDTDLVSQALVDAVRQVKELDHAGPYVSDRWEVRGDPDRQPGEIVQFTPASFGATSRRWLMSLRQTFTAREYVAEMEGWAGTGELLASGDDAVTIAVAAGPFHVGDEYLSHYAVPSPSGTTVTLPFTVPDEYTSIALEGWGHGVNSFLIDGGNADSQVSKVEVWQGGEEAAGTAELPVMPENLLERRDYTNPSQWTRFRLPVPGRLAPGSAELRLVSGVDTVGGQDDFEVRDLAIILRGAGTPALPGTGA